MEVEVEGRGRESGWAMTLFSFDDVVTFIAAMFSRKKFVALVTALRALVMV